MRRLSVNIGTLTVSIKRTGDHTAPSSASVDPLLVVVVVVVGVVAVTAAAAATSSDALRVEPSEAFGASRC